MKPNEENGKLPTAKRPFRVLVIAGSNRRQYNCPGVDSSLADLRLKWRELRMGMGKAPAGSSPARQEELGINRDATLSPKKGEGEKRREEPGD